MAALKEAEQLNYVDRMLTFQRKWREVCEKARAEDPRIWNDKLNKSQQEKITLLADHILQMGPLETRYFHHLLREAAMKRLKMTKIDMALSKEELERLDSGLFPGAHPKFIMQQEAMAKLWPLGQQGLASVFSNVVGAVGGGGGQSQAQGGAAQVQGGAQTKVEKQAEAPKVEKTAFDVELAGYDAANKIKIIKEVKDILKMELKEAKDLVDNAPCTLRKGMKKEDAEKLKEKLEALKCQIKLL